MSIKRLELAPVILWVSADWEGYHILHSSTSQVTPVGVAEHEP